MHVCYKLIYLNIGFDQNRPNPTQPAKTPKTLLFKHRRIESLLLLNPNCFQPELLVTVTHCCVALQKQRARKGCLSQKFRRQRIGSAVYRTIYWFTSSLPFPPNKPLSLPFFQRDGFIFAVVFPISTSATSTEMPFSPSCSREKLSVIIPSAVSSWRVDAFALDFVISLLVIGKQ